MITTQYIYQPIYFIKLLKEIKVNLQKIRHNFSVLAVLAGVVLGTLGMAAPTLTALVDDGSAATQIAGGDTINTGGDGDRF